jgi:hypothetical protein
MKYRLNRTKSPYLQLPAKLNEVFNFATSKKSLKKPILKWTIPTEAQRPPVEPVKWTGFCGTKTCTGCLKSGPSSFRSTIATDCMKASISMCSASHFRSSQPHTGLLGSCKVAFIESSASLTAVIGWYRLHPSVLKPGRCPFYPVLLW